MTWVLVVLWVLIGLNAALLLINHRTMRRNGRTRVELEEIAGDIARLLAEGEDASSR